jgi:hypothetical protein
MRSIFLKRSIEDFTQFEQRTAYFNGDHAGALGAVDLLVDDVSPGELAWNLGHRYCCLLERAGKFGLTLSDEDVAVFCPLPTRTSVSAFGTLKLARLTGCPSMRLTAPVRVYERYSSRN